MQMFIRHMRRRQLPSVASLRYYTPSSAVCQPTALHRATEASDAEKHPESSITQQKLPDAKHNHHWTESNATASEADVKADRDDVAKELASKKVQEEIATYGERGSG